MADNDNNLVFTVSSDMSAAQRNVNKFVGDIGTATNQVVKKFDALGRSIDKSVSTSMQQRINSMVGVGTKAANEWNGALADQGKELDRLRAKYSPLFATVTNYKKNIAEIRTLYRSNAIGVDEYTASLARERQATLASIAALKGRNSAQQQAWHGTNSFQTANLAAQGQDVLVQSFAGQSAFQIALQQGTQATQVIQQLKEAGGSKGVISGLTAAFGSLLSITSLVTIGFVALGAVAIQAVMKALPQVKSLDDAMKDHEASLKRVAAAYGGVAEEAAKAARENKRLVDAVALRNAAALSVAVASESKDYFGNSKVGSTPIGGRFRGFQATTTEFQEPLAKLRADVKAGKADFDAFYEAIARKVEANPSLAKAGNDVIAESDKLRQATEVLKEYKRVRDALFNDLGPNGRLLSQGTTNTKDMGDYALYQSQQAVAARRSSQAFYARLASEAARTTAERVAAARGEAAAQYNDESPQSRRQRIDQAGLDAYIRANRELNDAARERKLSLDAAVLSQQQDIGLVGKVGAAAESLRRQYQLTADLRSEAAKQGITDEKEFLKVYADQIALIKQNADEYGRLAEARARAQLSSDLSFQRDQFSRTPEQRNIAEQLKSAGLPIDFTSQAAKQLADANARDTQLAKDLARRSTNAQIAGINARSPAERIAAARAAAEAQYDPKEPTDLRAQRINNAELLARTQITKELADAERERTLNLKKLIEDQQQDIAMIGKTGGAAAAATQQYQLMAQLRAEAVKQGITSEAEFQKTFGNQIDLIKRATDGYGQLVDARAKAQLSYDLAQKARMATLDSQEQQVASTLKQYGLSDDLNSPEAKQIRQSLQAEDNRQQVVTFMSDFKNALVNNGDSIGKAFGTALQNALTKQADKLWDKLFNQVANAIFGTGTGAAGTTGTAATGVAGLGASTIGKIFGGGAKSATSVSSGSSAASTAAGGALSFVGNYKSGVDARLTDILSTAATKFPGYKVDAISGFRAGDKRFHGQGLATDVKLTDLATGKALSNYQDPSTFATYEKFAQTARSVQMQKYPELADNLRWGGYFSGGKGKYGAVDTMHFDLAGNKVGMGGGSWANGLNPQQAAMWPGIQSNGMNSAADAVNKLAENSKSAASSVGTFGNGLGSLGQQLSGAGGMFPAAPAASGGGGGIFGWLGGLFGGGASKSSQWNLAASGKLLPGLFADGGYTGPGGKNTPAGIVHAGEFVVPKHIVDKIGVPALSTMMKGYANGGLVTPALVSAPTAPSLTARRGPAANSNEPGILHVQISGASGDDHVRTLVKQGVGEGLSTYNQQQQRGGFGTLQGRFNAQKG